TLGDTEERRRYLNARSTIGTLLKWRAVPVINENDTVATNEIRYGDNDRLAARVATMVSADLLVLLSDVDGLYDAPPGAAANGRQKPAHLPRVEHPLDAIAKGARCTWFLAAGNPVTARKKWIAGSLEPRGTLTIDAGAV